LSAPLDIFLVRKLGFPGHEELAMGAVASGGIRVLNDDVAAYAPPGTVERVTERERRELERRENRYRGSNPPAETRGRKIILVDDGLATGASMRAAVQALRRKKPARIVAAVPVAAMETCRELEAVVDEMVCLFAPEPFGSVGAWYDDFSQITDQEVRELLERAQPAGSARSR
jgi:predicted phosphoribosyltransferase